MNESSSKFVDQFALEKLQNEKLSKVHHSPRKSFFHANDTPLAGFENIGFKNANISPIQDSSAKVFRIPSAVVTAMYPENNLIHLHFHPSPAPRGNVILVHGLFDDNVINYNFLIQLLAEAGLNVFLFVLPYHYERKPADSLFSGEFYLSGDLFRSQHAIKQGIFDLKTAIRFINYWVPLPAVIVGYSMGGNLSLRYFQLDSVVKGLFLINPVTRLSQLIWESPLLYYVQNDLEAAGYDLDEVQEFFYPLDPVKNIDSQLPNHRIAIGYSIYDQIIEAEKYLKLVEDLQPKQVYSYHAGHLNVLRVPKLSDDIVHFFSHL